MILVRKIYENLKFCSKGSEYLLFLRFLLFLLIHKETGNSDTICEFQLYSMHRFLIGDLKWLKSKKVCIAIPSASFWRWPCWRLALSPSKVVFPISVHQKDRKGCRRDYKNAQSLFDVSAQPEKSRWVATNPLPRVKFVMVYCDACSFSAGWILQ